MKTPLQNRQIRVLNAVIELHAANSAPVGSNTLVQTRRWTVSAATVRNEMAALEKQGYLKREHASAGRTPTQKAYRFYVDALLAKLPEPASTLGNAVRSRLQNPENQDAEPSEQLLNAACQLLAQLSHCIGVVLEGETADACLSRLLLHRQSDSAVLAALILDSGTVKQRAFALTEPVTRETVEYVERALNSLFAGKQIRQIRGLIQGTDQGESAVETAVQPDKRKAAVEIAQNAFLNEYRSQLYMDGIRLLITPRSVQNPSALGALYEAVESQDSLELLFQRMPSHPSKIAVRIGSELPIPRLDAYSVVSAAYKLRGNRRGTLGVIGPIRMPYQKVIPIVQLTAKQLSDRFKALP